MNPLPVNTAIQFESRQPTTAEILAYAASRKDKWFSPQAAPRKREEPIEQPVTRVYMTAPKQRSWTVQHDAHVRAFIEWHGNAPLAYLKMRCREIGISYAELIGASRDQKLVEHRHALMVEVKLKFPHCSNPFIATLFRRDHTVIYHALEKHGIHVPRKIRNPRRIADVASRVKKMFEGGKTYAEIGMEIDFHPAVVRRLVNKMGWTR